jgi:hypothetical protein
MARHFLIPAESSSNGMIDPGIKIFKIFGTQFLNEADRLDLDREEGLQFMRPGDLVYIDPKMKFIFHYSSRNFISYEDLLPFVRQVFHILIHKIIINHLLLIFLLFCYRRMTWDKLFMPLL